MISIQTYLSGLLAFICQVAMTSNNLRWGNSISNDNGVWNIDLVVPNPYPGLEHTIYVDQIEDGKNRQIWSRTVPYVDRFGDYTIRVNLDDIAFHGNTRIIKARVEYADGQILYSSEWNLNMLWWILGGVFGGIGFFVVVFCVYRWKRRERRKQRNLFNQTTHGVPTMGQVQINPVPASIHIPVVPTTGQHVIEVAQAPPMDQMPQAQTNGWE